MLRRERLDGSSSREVALREGTRSHPSVARLGELSRKTELLPKEDYASVLARAEKVLDRQSGVVHLPEDVPVVILQDVQGRRDMLANLMGYRIATKDDRERPLFSALLMGEAAAVLVGDVAHTEKKKNWVANGEPRLSEEELIATMGAEHMAFGLLSLFPNNFIWVRGNHGSQASAAHDSNEPFGAVKKFKEDVHQSRLIAQAMIDIYGQDFYEQWIRTENKLPLLAYNNNVVVTHAAPAILLDRADIEAKSNHALQALTLTQNLPGKKKTIDEGALQKNMEAILGELDLSPSTRWVIGHRHTEDEVDHYRVQCNGQLLQINHESKKMFVQVEREGTFKVGDLDSPHKPKLARAA